MADILITVFIFWNTKRIKNVCLHKIQGAHKLLEDFAKPYFHKYWTEIHDVTTIWKRNVCSFIVTFNAFDVRPMCDTADVQAILPFPPNSPHATLSLITNASSVTKLFIPPLDRRLRRTTTSKLPSECALNRHKFQDTPTTLSWWGSHFPPTLVYAFPARWQ